MGIPWSCHIFKLRDNLCEVVRTETRVQKSGSTTAQIDVSTRVIDFKLRSFAVEPWNGSSAQGTASAGEHNLGRNSLYGVLSRVYAEVNDAHDCACQLREPWQRCAKRDGTP